MYIVLDLIGQSAVSPNERIMSLILVQSHTLVEIYHEMFSMIILLLLIQERLMSVTRESMCAKYWLTA